MKNDERVTCGLSGGISTKTGLPCGGFINLSPNNGLCLLHDPERRELAMQVHRSGGHGTRRWKDPRERVGAPKMPDRPPQTLADAVRWASWAVASCALGDAEPQQIREVNSAVRVFTQAVKLRDLDKEVRELRAQVAALKKKPYR